MKRFFDPQELELMDVEQPISAELELDLSNLESLNRHFGGHRLVRGFLKCWLEPGGSYRILDLATGGGDLPRMMVNWARERQIKVTIDAVDKQASTLEIARRLSANYPEINYLCGDVRSFEADSTYDLVCCSLALHHFSQEDAILVLKRAKELSHDKVLISDLERSAFTTAAVYLLTATLIRGTMTRHDARLSTRRAFSFREFRELATGAGWENFGHQHFFPARQALWLSGPESAPEIALPPGFDFAT